MQEALRTETWDGLFPALTSDSEDPALLDFDQAGRLEHEMRGGGMRDTPLADAPDMGGARSAKGMAHSAKSSWQGGALWSIGQVVE